MTPAVAVISYNTRDLLRACLQSILAEEPPEVVVVDNASEDGSAQMVREEFPAVTVLALDDNVGYGAAANAAIAACTSPSVLVLNADTRLLPGALHALGTCLDAHPHAAVVGPRIENPAGELEPSCYPPPTPLHLFLQESGLWRLAGRLSRGGTYLRTWDHDGERVVPWVLGAALALRRVAFLSVGGFDPAFFLYNEEVDLCLRLAGAGWEVRFTPAARVVHVGGASTGRQRAALRVQFVASVAQLYRRHFSPRRRWEVLTLLYAVILGRLVRDALRLGLHPARSRRAGVQHDIHAWMDVLAGRWRRAPHG